MVHRDDAVEFTVNGPQKQGVGRERTKTVYTLVLCQRNSRRYYTLLFIAELTILTSVRIQTRNSNLRIIKAEVFFQGVIQQIYRLKDTANRKLVPHLEQGLMDCCQRQF